MALREAIRAAVETIAPPTLAELSTRLEAARTALVAAQETDSTAQAVLDVAYGADDQKLVLKAESDRAQTRLALERAAGRVASLERQLQAAEASQAGEDLAAGRKALAALKVDRERFGAQILNALDTLEGACQAFGVNEAAIMALPDSVRGRDAVPGHNLGAGALQAHLVVELRQRGIVGQPSSVQAVRLADWLSTGTKTLGTA